MKTEDRHFDWTQAETGKQFALGYDNHQRPLLYMFPYRQNTKPSRDQIRLLVWYLERTIALMPPGVESLTLVIDFGGPDAARIKSPGSPRWLSTFFFLASLSLFLWVLGCLFSWDIYNK
jgi:hypothetical protein